MQLLLSPKPVKASIVIGSFGSAQALLAPVFDVEFKPDPSAAPPTYEQPLRYGKLPEIHHIFRADPRSPPKIVSLVFVLAVAATVPALLVGAGDAVRGPAARVPDRQGELDAGVGGDPGEGRGHAPRVGVGAAEVGVQNV